MDEINVSLQGWGDLGQTMPGYDANQVDPIRAQSLCQSRGEVRAKHGEDMTREPLQPVFRHAAWQTNVRRWSR